MSCCNSDFKSGCANTLNKLVYDVCNLKKEIEKQKLSNKKLVKKMDFFQLLNLPAQNSIPYDYERYNLKF